MTKLFIAAGVVVMMLLGSVETVVGQQEHASDDAVMKLSEQLVALRSEVESLSQQLDAKKTEMNEQIRTINAQKAELEAQNRNEELRLKQLESAIQQARERLESTYVSQDYLFPIVLENCQEVRAYIEETLPFKQKERCAEVDLIAEQTAAKTLAPEKALAQLWALLEDEFRLSSEHGIYKQPIILEGKEKIADVIRLGMIMMYFHTEDGTVGLVARGKGGWNYLPVTDATDRDRIFVLYDALKKRIREGYFELPSPFQVR